MPYKKFLKWAFDGDVNTPIPDKAVLLKYNSPITHTYLLSIMIRNGKLNHYLNQSINNFWFRSIEKEEAFHFFKKCIKDFKVKRNSIHFVPPPRRKTKLFDSLRNKFPSLKSDDIMLLCDVIDDSDGKEQVYSTLGIDKPKKQKVKVKKETKKKKSDSIKKLSLDKFMSDNFKIMETE